jgi:hypothetical protein
LTVALFSDLSFHRRKEAASAGAHFITGVLEQELMESAIETLCQSADWKVGDRVKTLRGSLPGVILCVLDDGRGVWKPADTESALRLVVSLLPPFLESRQSSEGPAARGNAGLPEAHRTVTPWGHSWHGHSRHAACSPLP